jgi:hypothetical protein
MTKTILPATFLAALLSLPLSASAGTVVTPSTVVVDVELTETTKKVSETVSVTMTVAAEGSCASASSHDGDVSYELELCRGRDDAGAPVLSFDVQRRADTKAGTVSRHVKVSSKLAAGTRTVVGRIARGDEATEIAATVR